MNYDNYAVLTLHQERCQDLISSHQEGLKCSVQQVIRARVWDSGEVERFPHCFTLYVCKLVGWKFQEDSQMYFLLEKRVVLLPCQFTAKTPKFLILDTPLGTNISGGYSFQFLPCTAFFFRKHVRHDCVFQICQLSAVGFVSAKISTFHQPVSWTRQLRNQCYRGQREYFFWRCKGLQLFCVEAIIASCLKGNKCGEDVTSRANMFGITLRCKHLFQIVAENVLLGLRNHAFVPQHFLTLIGSLVHMEINWKEIPCRLCSHIVPKLGFKG